MLLGCTFVYLFLFLHFRVLTCATNFPTPNCAVDDNYDCCYSDTPRASTFLILKLRRVVDTITSGLIIVLIILNVIVYALWRLSGEGGNRASLRPGTRLRRFSLAEIELATNNLNDALVIGQGGFGKVYKGFIDDGQTTVAVKRCSMSRQGAFEFWTEIEMLSMLRDSHIVPLIGYCDDSQELMLVYKYMLHGTLAHHLHKLVKTDHSSLSWVQRLKICIDAARGLNYLHSGMSCQHRVIHGDIKSSNILLDENWSAKISDFGLSALGLENQSDFHVITDIKGTFGYLDPEYFLTRRMTKKSDVYAFGVVMFEVLCGRLAVDLSVDEEQRGLAPWAQHCIKEGRLDQIIDPSLKGQILPNCLLVFAQIADQCLDRRPKSRPTMAELLVRLEFALELQENTDSFILEEESCHSGGDGAYNHQGNVDSPIEEEVSNVGHAGRHDKQNDGITQLSDARGRQSSVKPARRTFTRKVGLVYSVTAQLFSANRAKPSRNCKHNNYNHSDSPLLSRKIETPNLRTFTLAELRRATSNFGSDMVLGKGGFGIVFKGWIDEKTYAPLQAGVGMAVAIKKVDLNGHRGPKEAKVKFLGKITHPNLVKLLGYCLEDEEFLLVSEYMQNRSLDDHLFDKNAEPMPWVARFKIATGAARGLAFLHRAKEQALYRSFKASDILLDMDFNAKLSDFGLVKFRPTNGESIISTLTFGDTAYTDFPPKEIGYIDPEYVATGHLTVKSDIYGFGVVLLELLTGRRVLDLNRPDGKHDLARYARPFLAGKRNLRSILDHRLECDHLPADAVLSTVAALTLKCLEDYPKNRPEVTEVLETLEEIDALQMEWN
ncbi:hypothetical protein RJ640_011337 [Escallonia rubra]|uniref:Protein kinase domain-containing protein n=1 Tax=Escallonia rubra TaxID=112253 RepID=A0AA88UMK8_9ASTE|nr:hypothetical protein RJ640_011337 [Escallonia rubra]